MSTRVEVVHGDPSDEELAVVISLLSAAAAAAPAPAPEAPMSNWARPAMRWTPAPGPGAWVRTGLPQ
jgi:hypothetical protein